MNKWYQPWIDAGRPHVDARVIQEYRGKIKVKHPNANVWSLGNTAHLTASVPEDHTPYSQTGYTSHGIHQAPPLHVVTAIDVSNMPDLDKFAAKALADAKAGRAPWIKYLNFNGHHWTYLDHFSVVHSSSDGPWVHLSFFVDKLGSIGSYDPLVEPPVNPPLDRTLVNGDHGTDVAHLQSLLNSHGASPRLTVDGEFGDRTESAVRVFQSHNGLTVDGKVGPATTAKLGW